MYTATTNPSWILYTATAIQNYILSTATTNQNSIFLNNVPNKTKYCTQLKQNILHREMSKNIILIYLQNYNIIYYLYKFYFVCPMAVMNYITNLVPDGEAMLSSQVMDGRPLVDLHQEQVQVVVVLWWHRKCRTDRQSQQQESPHGSTVNPVIKVNTQYILSL